MTTKSELPIVRLREVEASDLPFIFENQRDPVAVEMVAYNSRDREAFDEHWAKILADDTSLKRTIVVASAASADSPGVVAPKAFGAVSAESHPQEEVAGSITSWTADGKREVGYWLGRAYWGRGIATAALAAFLRLEKTRPLHASVAEHNTGSIRVLQKCGFTIVASPDESCDDADIRFVHFMLSAPAAP